MNELQTETSESEVDNVDFELVDAFVAPWGLAHEERPMHLLWNGSIDGVEVTFPEPVELLEAFNLEGDLSDYVESVNNEEGDLQRVNIDSDDLDTPGYLSIKFKIPTIFDDAMVGQVIGVKFHRPDSELFEVEGYTFTIRPQIELVEEPETVVITEDEELDRINVQMRYLGFGLAQVDIEARGEGELISKGESLYHDIAEALIASGFHKLESDDLEPIPEEWKDDTGVEIPQSTLENIVQGVRDSLTDGSAFDEFEEEELHQLADVLEEGDDERDFKPVYEHVELMLLNSILDVVERHPTENVQLQNPHTSVQIQSKLRGFTVVYRLSDNHGNVYDPTKVQIEVQDNRDDGGVVETEINTEWEHHQLDPHEVLTEIMEEL